jgi:hypothetical protein
MRVPAVLDRLRPATTDTARRTGGAYLGIVGAGLFAEFFVRMSLVAPDDPAATARAIADSQALFLSGVGADVAMIGLDVAVGIGLFRLLRHVDERLAVIATVSRFVQAAVLTVNLVNPVRALGFARAAADGTTGAAEQALAAMEAHALAYDIGLIAFAVSCLAVARLLSRSGVAPKLLWRGLAATGVVYLVGSLAAVFAPGLSSAIDPFYGIAIVVEPAFAIWLMVRGRRLAPATPVTAAA